MNPDTFAKIAESLRQYRRAELKDFQADVAGNVMDQLYVDPLDGNAVLQTVLSNNTTFLVGRKGTGKSTVFAKAQSDIRKRTDLISVYIDVKSVYELVNSTEPPIQNLGDAQVSHEVLRVHCLRKAFLGAVLSGLIKEIGDAAENLSLWDRWMGKKRDYQDIQSQLGQLANNVKTAKLTEQEVPILRLITRKTKDREERKESQKDISKGKVGATLRSIDASAETSAEDINEAIADQEIYQEYSDAILRSFPFAAIIEDIKDLLNEAGMTRVVCFFDDFSELAWPDQKLFVDVILAPLNNASDERIKLKIAGYPGRIYYGKIDPGKVDTLRLDFFELYKAADVQTAEGAAINYTQRLLDTRFTAFGDSLSAYFSPNEPLLEYVKLIFETTLNVPRLIGYILHHCYLDRVSKGQTITFQTIRLASQKYYEGVMTQYFDRANRFALEPFERKLDRHNQKVLLNRLIAEARDVRRRISTGEIGSTYFSGLTNPPVSHFAVSPQMDKILASLEMNFLVTKYHEMRDKDGSDVSIFALFYGLCEAERFPWGYPKGRREDRSYFVQRCFNYNTVVREFLAKSQTIRCDNCGACFPVEQRESFELSMKASEISALIDVTYQLVGKRTTKLQQMGLVNKADLDGAPKSTIKDKARTIYFNAQ
jgi:hypothetical protein